MIRRKAHAASLSEVHSSVNTGQEGFFRKLLAFSGPAFLVSVGYMDPGNWATDIAGGSQYGYTLIWVLLMSNLIALLLQSLSARLGVVRGLDLAQASRESYPPAVNFSLWLLAEIAIAACDLAEVLGMAIGLQLLFNISLLTGVCITVADTFILLILQQYGIRKLEAFILGLISVIGLSFLAEMILAKPLPGELVKGFIPSLPDHTALYIAIGIIGATVMPHNLYLHSALVQTRRIDKSVQGIKSAIRFNIIDSAVALNLAFFVNAAILILAASTFYKAGLFNISEIKDAYHFLSPLLGTKWASILFAVALIAAGQSSTITGTLAGQIVMEGYLSLRIQPWLRRLLTRMLAIIPAFITISVLGEGSAGKLLVLSQVVLSLQLGFAIIPLIHFVSNKKKMGIHSISFTTKTLAWLSALVIISLNVKLVAETLSEWMSASGKSLAVWLFVIPVVVVSGLLLIYIFLFPMLSGIIRRKVTLPHGMLPDIGTLSPPACDKIAIAVDFSEMDAISIAHAVAQGKKDAEYLLVHVVETAGAFMMGNEIRDFETESDHENMLKYANQLQGMGYHASFRLGYGNPKKVIPEIVNGFAPGLLVMGAHGHNTLKDLLFGTTIEAVRHKIKIPLLVVRK